MASVHAVARQIQSADGHVRDPVPTVNVPLLRGDADVSVNLQEVISSVYDRADYHLSMNYHAELDPPLTEEERIWIDDLLRQVTPQ